MGDKYKINTDEIKPKGYELPKNKIPKHFEETKKRKGVKIKLRFGDYARIAYHYFVNKSLDVIKGGTFKMKLKPLWLILAVGIIIIIIIIL